MAKARYDVYPLTPALRLGLVTVLTELVLVKPVLVETGNGDWALALTALDLQSVRQQTCSDCLLSAPLNDGKIISFTFLPKIL